MLKFEGDRIELSFKGREEVGDRGVFRSLDLFNGFFGTFSLVDYFSFFYLVLELEDIEISKALSLMRLRAPTSSAADLSELVVAYMYI